MDREARKKQTITAFNEWLNEEDPSKRYAMVESMWHSTPGKWLQTQRPEWSHDHDYRLRIPLGYGWNGSDKEFHCFVSEKDRLFASTPVHDIPGGYFGMDDACGDTRGDLWNNIHDAIGDCEVVELRLVTTRPVKLNDRDNEN